jgi:glycosyltransferase involved in cell wall biosynthesis
MGERGLRARFGRGERSAEPQLPTASLDLPRPGTRLEGGPLVIGGWALFADGPLARVEAWLDEVPLGRARLGLPRHDVAAMHSGADALVSGFELRAGIELPEAGEREALLRVVATSLGGERRELDPVTIVLASAPVVAPRRPRLRQSTGAGRRVLAFSNVLTLGGAAIYLAEVLLEAHRRERVAPTVVTAIDGPLREDLEAEGIPVHVLSALPLHDLDAYEDRVEELVAWAAPQEFELVLVNTATALTLPGADLAKRLGLPAIWSIHESFHPDLLWEGLAPGMAAHAEAELADATFAIFAAEATRALYERSLTERSAVMPYGIDLAPIEAERVGFDRGRARREAGIPEGATLVVCVGTIEPRKAQLSLAQAFARIAAQHPDAQLAFVGSDGNVGSETLAEWIAVSPCPERFHVVPRTRAVQRWIGMADLLVCASDVESLPKTVLEAMAWGTPVLSTAIFGVPEVIEDGISGWLCEPGDVAAMEVALGDVLGTDPERRRRIGLAGRDVVLEHHDLGEYAERLADAFDLAAEGKPIASRLAARDGGGGRAGFAPGSRRG